MTKDALAINCRINVTYKKVPNKKGNKLFILTQYTTYFYFDHFSAKALWIKKTTYNSL